MINNFIQNPLLLLMFFVILLIMIVIAFIVLVLMGNLIAMKVLAKSGIAVFSRNIVKDYKLLNYVNKEGIGWLHIPDVCYSPVMKYVEGKYNNHNFLQKSNLYGELYITEGDSAIKLQSLAHKTENNIPDLAIIRGSAKGSNTNLRHANFSILSKCNNLLKEKKVVELCDKGVVRTFDVIAVLDMTIGEKRNFEYSSRKKFINSLLNIANEKKINELNSNNNVLLLQCKTEIDTIMVVLLEK